jgi:hypothetical protein
MPITYREYQDKSDLDLQYKFWIKITKDMPWSWKPTISPSIFINGKQFDPRTRVFAFDEDKLVGYMSFTGEGTFVSLGYPWVLPGYEGEIQEELYDRVFGFASSNEYGGKFFAQRFREQWIEQIEFFIKKGFSVTSSQSLLGTQIDELDLNTQESVYTIEISDDFNIDDFIDVARRTKESITEEEEEMVSQYFQSVDFDHSVIAKKDDLITAISGVTIREDTGYSEVLSLAVDRNHNEAFSSSLAVLLEHLKQKDVKNLGIPSVENKYILKELKKLNFKHITANVMLGLKIE